MCGIFGYVGTKDAVNVCIKGLQFLEYRGYDSSGIAGVSEEEIHYCKETGNIGNLEKAVVSLKKLRNAIAHTRWATHGKPSKQNAHPHFDENSHIAVVHNGIIENHSSLRQMLIEKGYTFYSETDSEVIAQLISHFYEGNFVVAVQKALDCLHGFWGLAIIHKNHPNQIIASCKENPLAIGISPSTEEIFISSDVNAFHEPDLDVLFLNNNELAHITPEGVTLFDPFNTPIQKITEKLLSEQKTQSKNGFDHYMLKEIFEQPDTIRQAMHGRYSEELGTAIFEELALSKLNLSSIERVLILACGTSWHAGYIAASWIEEKVKIPAQAEIASEFRYKNPIIQENTLIIAISQSGETFDTIGSVREVKAKAVKGVKILSICNTRNSTLTRDSDACLFLKAGPEISVCSTKAFTSQLTLLSLFTLFLARLKNKLSIEEGKTFLKELQMIPMQADLILRQSKEIQVLAKKYAVFPNFFFLGRNYMYPTCLEAALKLKEISYINAVAYPAGEMKHGPIALADEHLGVIGLCGNQRTLDKMLSNLMEIKARAAPILAIAFQETSEIAEIADDVLWLPRTSDELAAIPFSIATQLLAYYIALEKGAAIDQPRNLAKSVTVE